MKPPGNKENKDRTYRYLRRLLSEQTAEKYTESVFLVLVILELSGVYTSNLLYDLEFYLGQIYEAKSLGKYLAQKISFIKGQYLVQIRIQIVKQIGCVDAALWTQKGKYVER